MNIIEDTFIPPTDEGFNFASKTSLGKYRWYHGTSTFFSEQIETNGFIYSHDFISQEEKRVIKKLSSFIPGYGSFGCPFSRAIESRLSLSFAQEPRGALSYAWGTSKGGTFRQISERLKQITIPTHVTVDPSDLEIVKTVSDRFSVIPSLPGVVYALEFSDDDLSKLTDPNNNIRHLRSDIQPNRITHKMVVPVNFIDR